jgi:uncharacterized membrane protein (DUF2068 family)
MPTRRSDLVIRGIAVFKLLKAALLIAIGVGALSMHRDHSGLRIWIDAVAIDPHGKYLTELLARLTALRPRQLDEIGVASLLYAAVFVVEGIGLMLRRAWAEILTVVVTTSFIPLEVYELWSHASWARATVLAFNVVVVLYLLRRLKQEQHWPFHRAAQAVPQPG